MTISTPVLQPVAPHNKTYLVMGAVTLDVIALLVSIWALYKGAGSLIGWIALGGLVILLVSPLILAYLTASATQREMTMASLSLVDAVRSILRRYAYLLILSAGLIPALTIAMLYVQMQVLVIFASIVSCFPNEPCPRPPVTLPTNLMSETLLALIFMVGLWGLNFLAITLSAGLVLRSGKRPTGAALFTMATIVIVFFALLALISYSRVPEEIRLVSAGLLPFGATYLLALVLGRKRVQSITQPW